MPLVNYCRKCRTETPLGESCPYCGGRLPKTGEQLSFGIIRNPVTDWFSWNDVLRVALPAWLVALAAVLAAEAVVLMQTIALWCIGQVTLTQSFVETLLYVKQFHFALASLSVLPFILLYARFFI